MPETTALSLWVPFLPPSENRIRVHRRQGGQVYSKEARDFKTQFSDYMRENYFIQINQFVAEHTEQSIYSVTMVFTMETLINKGWAKKKAKTLYKKVDVGNRRKLIEDCLSTAFGEIDDSLFFELHLRKEMGPEQGVEILVERVAPELFGVPHVTRAE
jgi:Holliday junction resolvase RusA-like endonuclease